MLQLSKIIGSVLIIAALLIGGYNLYETRKTKSADADLRQLYTSAVMQTEDYTDAGTIDEQGAYTGYNPQLQHDLADYAAQTLQQANLPDETERDHWADAVPLEIKQNPLAELFARNHDLVGWLTISDTRIDYPVVRALDNEYYMDRDFDRNKTRAGSIFMDYRNTGTGADQHTIIYGHHTRDGTMFTDLLKFGRQDFYDQHRVITLKTLFGEAHYKVFATYTTKADPSYIRTRFDSQSFAAFMTQIEEKSNFAWDTDVAFGDKLLTLTTCAYDFDEARFVLHAVLIESDDLN